MKSTFRARPMLMSAAIAATLQQISPCSAAVNNYWTLSPSQTGSWFAPANWSRPTIPSPTHTAYIANGGTATITSGNAGAQTLYLGQTGGGTLSQSGGLLALTDFTVSNTGRYRFSGGTLSIADRFDLLGELNFLGGAAAINVANNGVLDLSRGTTLNASNAAITAGVGSNIYLPMGVDARSFFGSVTTQGAVFNVSGSTLIVPAGFTLNATVDRTERMQIQGTLRSKDANGSWTNFTASKGGVEVATGGLMDTNGNTFSVQADSAISGGTLNDGSMAVGTHSKAATFTQSGGTVNTSGGLTLQGKSRYAISGGALNVGTITTSDNGDVFQQSGGTATVSRVTVQSGGQARLTGGTLQINNRFDLLAKGTVDFGNGNASLTLADYGVADFSAGTLLNASGTRYSAGIGSESYFPKDFNPYAQFKAFNSQGLVHAPGTSIVLPATYSGSIHRLDTGSLEVSGTVVLDDGAEITASEGFTLSGSLKGSGQITAASFENAGVLSPGMSPGALGITGPFTQTAEGKLIIELAGLTAGTGYDQITITGNAQLGGTLQIEKLGDFVPPVGTTFDILLASSFSDDFALVVDNTGLGIQVAPAEDGSVYRLTTTAVPEPTYAGVLVVSTLLLKRYRSRRVA